MLHTGPLTRFCRSLILKQCLCCLSNYDSKGLSQVCVSLAPAGCDHLLSLLQRKCLICRTRSAGKQAPVQFEIIHEGNKERLRTCPRLHGSGSEERQSHPHKSSWYSRSEDLSDLILVRDIRHAVVGPPISQGKAPKWHDSIHLRREDKHKEVTALIIGDETLGSRHKIKGFAEQHGKHGKEEKRVWWNTVKACSGQNKRHLKEAS